MLPYHKDPVIINANVTGRQGHMTADKFVIIHIVLLSLARIPSPVNFVHNLMLTYLGNALLYEKVEFYLQGNGLKKHQQTLEKLLHIVNR